MEKIKWARIVALSFLFVVSYVLLPNNTVISKAQNRPVAPNLEGTEWEAVFILPAGTVQCRYLFGDQGTATSRCFAITAPGTMAGTNINDPMFNPMADDPYKPKLVITPPTSGPVNEVSGKYSQTGNSIRVEFSDAVVNATIYNNVLSGEFIYKDSSKGKLNWNAQRSSAGGSGSAILSNRPGASQPPKFLSRQILEKYKPTGLMTRVLSGQLKWDVNVKEHYYTFVAGPGEISITLFVESHPQASLNSVSVALFNNNEQMLTIVQTSSNYGRTTQAVARINVPNKEPMLLRIQELTNMGIGKYRIQLDGAFETEAARERPSSSSTSDQVASDSRREAAQTLYDKAKHLSEQGKNREAIGLYGTILQLDLDTKQFTILAYTHRGEAKLKLQDYEGALEDFSRAIQLSVPIRANYDAKRAQQKTLTSRKPNASSTSHANTPADPSDAITAASSASIPPEVAAAIVGLNISYIGRAAAKSKLGDRAGACADLRSICIISPGSYCQEPNEFCN